MREIRAVNMAQKMKTGQINWNIVAPLAALLIFAIVPYARLSDIYLPSQLKEGFYSETSTISTLNEEKIDNYILTNIKSDCNMLPCRSEVYNYRFGKSLVQEKESEVVKSNSGITIKKDTSWIKSAGIGGKS